MLTSPKVLGKASALSVSLLVSQNRFLNSSARKPWARSNFRYSSLKQQLSARGFPLGPDVKAGDGSTRKALGSIVAGTLRRQRRVRGASHEDPGQGRSRRPQGDEPVAVAEAETEREKGEAEDDQEPQRFENPAARPGAGTEREDRVRLFHQRHSILQRHFLSGARGFWERA